MPTDDTEQEIADILLHFGRAMQRLSPEAAKHVRAEYRQAGARLSEYVTRKQVEARIEELKNIAFSHLSDELKDFIWDEYTAARLEQLQGGKEQQETIDNS